MDNKYQINEMVRVQGREKTCKVLAIYHVETWYYYALQGFEDFLIKESRLSPVSTGGKQHEKTIGIS
jgi:hypothetical protein